MKRFVKIYTNNLFLDNMNHDVFEPSKTKKMVIGKHPTYYHNLNFNEFMKTIFECNLSNETHKKQLTAVTTGHEIDTFSACPVHQCLLG